MLKVQNSTKSSINIYIPNGAVVQATIRAHQKLEMSVQVIEKHQVDIFGNMQIGSRIYFFFL
jgi:hypothetical protein